MKNDNNITSASNDYGFYKQDAVYIAYLKNGGSTNIDLSGASGNFELKWFNPRIGGFEGQTKDVSGGGNVATGNPPGDTNQDWVVLISKKGLVNVKGNPFRSVPVFSAHYGNGQLQMRGLEYNKGRLTIHDMLGNSLYDFDVNTVGSQNVALDNGLYFIHVSTGKNSQVKKLIVK